MGKTTSATNKDIAFRLSNNLPRLLREFSRDFERRIYQQLAGRGFPDIRASHHQVFANLGMGSVRVTELAERAQVTQQAMGKMLKELERMGYVARDIDGEDRRAKQIRLTDRGVAMVQASMDAVDEIQALYQDRVGTEALLELEEKLREAVKALDLEYLPESWTDTA